MSNPSSNKKTKLDYERYVESAEFKELVKKKKRFSTPYVVFFFAAYFMLPILTGYTSILENRAVGYMTWTWVYAFSMFFMVWIFTSIYMNKSKHFDADVDTIIEKNILK